MKGKKQKQKRQERWVIIGAVAIVLVSVALTFYFSSPLSRAVLGRAPSGYLNVTFTDAVLSCQHRTAKEFAGQLTGLAVDDHSSRRDDRKNRYLIFFHAGLLPKDDLPAEFYIHCEVNASSGRIELFEGLELESSPVEPLQKIDGGLFGWP